MAGPSESCVAQIGNTAGAVWHMLNEHVPLSLGKLAKKVKAPRDIVMQSVGWLAREGKVDIQATKRGRIVILR